MEAKIMKISSKNFSLCWMLFWTGVILHPYCPETDLIKKDDYCEP